MFVKTVSPFCAPQSCVGFLPEVSLVIIRVQPKLECVSDLVICLLPSYITVDYRAHPDRWLDMANLIGAVLSIFVAKVQNIKVKVKFSLEQATKAQRESRGLYLLFL